ERYQLQDFGLGFIRLALETQTPIVPMGVGGGEAQAPGLFNAESLAKLLGIPAFPVTVTGLPLALPVRYHLHFGKPMHFTGQPDEEDSEIDVKVRAVKAAVQSLIERGLREREGVFR